MRRAVACVAGLLALLAVAAPAAAQYPPGPPPLCSPPTGVVDFGVKHIGDVFSLRVCGPYRPGSTVQLVFDGTPAGTKIAAADGSIVLNVNIHSLDRIEVDDILPGVCARNSLLGDGPSPTGGTSSGGLLFTLVCTNQVVVTPPGATTSPSGAIPVSQAVFTAFGQQQQQQQQQLRSGTAVSGTNIVTNPLPAAGTQVVTPTPGKSVVTSIPGVGGTAGGGPSRAVFTGLNVARWTLLGLAALALGGALTTAARRRRLQTA